MGLKVALTFYARETKCIYRRLVMWYFRKMSRAEINQDPTQEDYFNTDHLDNFSDALVREAIQNSLDAKLKGSSGPVKVRITFPSIEDLPTNADAFRLFEQLNVHIESAEVIEKPQVPDERITYLVFEDFGTKGLVGDPRAADDPSQNEDADFYYFWRNIGRGKKRGDERGRWGLGKTMFPASSQIHSFFGLTVRADDNRKLLMGQSVLSVHHLDGNKYYPYGYFGTLDGDDGFVVPIEDADVIDDFTLAFSISRESEPGLSVVVPIPREEITSKGVIQSTIYHYFFPILSGELVVEIAANGKLVEINKNSVDQVASEYLEVNDDSFSGTVKLAKWYLEQDKQDISKAAQQTLHKSPAWKDEIFTNEQLERFAETLDTQKPVIVRVPVYVIPTGEQPRLSYFDLVMERDPKLEKPLDVFIRSGITISGVHSLRESGIRTLLIAQDMPIVTMLGDAENPAHTEWQDRSRKFVGKYRVGKSTLVFVKDAPRGFLRLLNRRSEQIDDTALRHIFPDDLTKPENAPPSPVPGISHDPTRTKKPRIAVDTRPRVLKLIKVDDGFSVRLTEHGIKSLPINIRIRIAYDVSRGNPYKRWAPADFDLGKESKNIGICGGKILNREGNRMELLADSGDFLLKVSGFDPVRDLIVDLRREVETDAA